MLLSNLALCFEKEPFIFIYFKLLYVQLYQILRNMRLPLSDMRN